MAFNSDEVNLLVYRYLEESGFRHSAFTFGYESNVLNAGLDSTTIPRGALMSLLQKGVLFAEAEVFSLLNDGEMDATFEKAIGCMTILECVMCDSTKTKALERKMGIHQKFVHNNAPAPDEQGQRTLSRIGQQIINTPVDQQSTNLLHQSHGMNQTRPDSNSSTKSTNAVYQQLQGNRDREFRSQQPAGHANSSVQSRGATYRTNQADHLGSMENRGTKCNPTLASTSSGPSITTSNHLHPGTNTTAVLGMHHHPFYPQPTFGKHLGHPETASYLAVNISNGSGNSINGPTQQSLQQIASTTGTFPTSLSNLHHQGLGANNQATADLTRMMLNGTSTPYLTASGSNSTGLGTKRGTGNG